MKKLLLVLSIMMIVLSSCENCYECRRVWTNNYPDGTTQQSIIEDFEVCSKNDRDNAEETQTRRILGGSEEFTSTGVCVCTEQ
jgi:hypothetical protein